MADNRQESTAGGSTEVATNDAVEELGLPRTMSTGSTAGAVLEFAGQSAFTKNPRQRRGAIVSGDRKLFAVCRTPYRSAKF